MAMKPSLPPSLFSGCSPKARSVSETALNKMFRPFLVSPIAFSAFWGPMYAQQNGGGLSLTMALYAFQIGFMWQHVLEKKVGGN